MKLLTASAIALILSSGSVHAAEVPDSLIEKTLGITGVKHEKVTHTKYGMTYSDVSYKTQSGELLLILRLGTAEQYAFWKQAAGPAVAPVRKRMRAGVVPPHGALRREHAGPGADQVRQRSAEAVLAAAHPQR